MIASLRGTLIYKSPQHVVVDVHGVGYRVALPLSAFARLPEAEKPITLHIHTHVREDAIQLYGFLAQEERDVFVLLIGVSGIGPKSANAILSGMSVADLCDVVSRGDEAHLGTVPGIGKKTAARIILELREKMPALRSGGASDPHVRAGRGVFDDVLSALVNLGYPRARAQEVIERIFREEGDGLTLESALKAALRSLSRP